MIQSFGAEGTTAGRLLSTPDMALGFALEEEWIARLQLALTGQLAAIPLSYGRSGVVWWHTPWWMEEA